MSTAHEGQDARPDQFDCIDPLFQLLQCRDAVPVDFSCEQFGPQECYCQLDDLQNDVYESNCSGDVCDCLAKGVYVGTCFQDPMLTEICDPIASCCSALGYIASPP